MRFVEILHISKDEIRASELSLVSRAKNKMMDNMGHKMLSACPSIVSIYNDTDEPTLNVTLDMVVFSTKDFHAMVQHMSEKMSQVDFKILTETMKLKELP